LGIRHLLQDTSRITRRITPTTIPATRICKHMVTLVGWTTTRLPPVDGRLAGQEQLGNQLGNSGYFWLSYNDRKPLRSVRLPDSRASKVHRNLPEPDRRGPGVVEHELRSFAIHDASATYLERIGLRWRYRRNTRQACTIPGFQRAQELLYSHREPGLAGLPVWI